MFVAWTNFILETRGIKNESHPANEAVEYCGAGGGR